MDRIKTADFKHNQPKMELGPHHRYFDFFGSNVMVAEQTLNLFVAGSNPPSRTTPEWSNGRTPGFGPGARGSSPFSGTNVTFTGVHHGLICQWMVVQSHPLRPMMNLINKRLKLLKEQLKATEIRFEEYDNSEDMHQIDHLGFAIEQFKSFKKEMKAKLAEE
jgi:hypothetical protein